MNRAAPSPAGLADRLRRALAEGHAHSPDLLPGDGGEPLGAVEDTAAAVLVAITDRAEPGVLLTLRTEGLRRHAGQVAFPGGRVDPGDADAVAAALREAEEEIALPPAAVDLIGLADPYRTITGFAVTPVLGVVPPDLPLVAEPGEVAAIFEVPLAHILDPAHHRLQSVFWQGAPRTFYEIDWDGQRIWGATAAMIVNLSRRLAPFA
ncbi:CoA pyrophosphatase [Allosphingosinicella indica]|nr:CoA pyrophosphatase [Allosphingosinicella indica]